MPLSSQAFANGSHINQQAFVSDTARRGSLDIRRENDPTSRPLRETALRLPRDLRRGHRDEQGNIRFIHGNVEDTGYPFWDNLESQGPSLELSPVVSKAPIMVPREHRFTHPVAGASSPLSITGNTQSQVSIPNSISNGIDLRTPIVVQKSTPSTISADSLPIETETPGERMLLET